MKTAEKIKALEMRSLGRSMNDIASELGVSKGTVSVWVRHIEVPNHFVARCRNRRTVQNYAKNGIGLSRQARKKREAHQENGRSLINNQPWSLFAIGCMLYWGEGSKSKNMMCFSNSDPAMVKVFMKFLREACDIKDERITLRVHGFLGNGIEREDVLRYWLDATKLPSSQLRACTFDRHSPSSSRRKKNLIYGTVHLTVCSVELVQKIYGGISEIAGSTNPLFINGNMPG